MQLNIFDQPGIRKNKRPVNLISIFFLSRSLWPDDFGDENNEIDVALTILYESLKKTHTTASMFDSEKQTDYLKYIFHLDLLVILQQTPPIADVCHRLYELNLKILSSTPDPL